MKSKLRLWHPGINSPWLTRREAGDYLRWSLDTVDRNLVPLKDFPDQPMGKMRFEVLASAVKKIRILASDVYALCPLPDDQ